MGRSTARVVAVAGLLPVVLAVQTGAPPAFASASARTEAYADCTHAAYEPRSWVLACADAGAVLEKVHYRSWTSKVARGRAIEALNICRPNCAEGHYRRYRVTFTVSRPVQIHGRTVFTRVTVHRRGRHAEVFSLPSRPL